MGYNAILVYYVLGCLLSIFATRNTQTMEDSQSKMLTCAAWNMRGMGTSGPYMKQLLSEVDILALSEHKLFECELWKLADITRGVTAHAKSSDDLLDADCGSKPGHCGVALMWKDDLSQYIRPVKTVGLDRICAVEVCFPGRKILTVIAVYLPHAACTIANYTEQLDSLETLVHERHLRGDVTILGDLNAHFGPDAGIRCWGKTTVNGGKFLDFSRRNELSIVDIEEGATGPVHTFANDMGGSSYIDHCVVTSEVRTNVHRCWVFQDCIANTSDHLPIGITLAVGAQLTAVDEPCSAYTRIKWHKLDSAYIQETYTRRMEEASGQLLQARAMQTSLGTLGNKTNIDKLAVDFTEAVHASCSGMPMEGRQKHLKPYWSPELSMLSKQEKTTWKAWIQAGRPRSADDTVYQQYKAAKRIFRRRQRQTMREYELRQIEDLIMTQEMDQRRFWQLVNKARSPKKSAGTPVVSEDGHILTCAGDIAEDWAKYYEKLFRLTEGEAGQQSTYDEPFREHVEREVKLMEIDSEQREHVITRHPITEDELVKAIQRLKNRKAPGCDGITNEHIKNIGPAARQAILLLFNSMVECEHIPAQYKQGLIVPIPKGGKDASIKDNNRGITLLSCVYKLFESILLVRMDNWLKHNSVIHELQGAFQDGCSCQQVAMVLQETIQHNRERGATVHVVLLDVRKAFDTVWTDGLLYRLYHTGLEGRLWRILKECYAGFRCSVMVRGHRSQDFAICRGVHQGAPMSMRLYQLYNNELLRDLGDTGLEAQIYELKTGNPAYADDVAVVCLAKQTMNSCLSTALSFSKRWRFDFNIKKTIGLVFGPDNAPDQQLHMGGDIIATSRGSLHMGVPLADDAATQRELVQERTGSVTRQVSAMSTLGTWHNPLPPSTGAKLYEAACLPKLMYGLEACDVGQSTLAELESTHRRCALRIQGLPQQTPLPVPLATLGWMRISGAMDVVKMTFLYGLLLLPYACMYKRVAIARLAYHIYDHTGGKHGGPILQAYEACSRHGLAGHILDILNTGHGMSKREWKRLVDTTVRQSEQTRWYMTCLMYKKLPLFSSVVASCNQRWVWWVIGRRCPDLSRATRAMLKLLCLGVNTGQFGGHRLCSLCTSFKPETVEHLLFECDSFSASRQCLWDKVLGCMPEAMKQQVTVMPNEQKCIFILSGALSGYIPEWINIYRTMADFVWGLYNLRAEQFMQPGG